MQKKVNRAFVYSDKKSMVLYLRLAYAILLLIITSSCNNPFFGASLNSENQTEIITNYQITYSSGIASSTESATEISDEIIFSLDNSLNQSATFNLKAYTNASCTNLASGTLSASENPVTYSSGNSIKFEDVTYTLPSADSESIYVKVVSSLSTLTSSQCSGPVEVDISPIVLGQSNFTSNASQTVINATSFAATEYKIHSNRERLVVSDYSNSRILIWNEFPTTILETPDVVLGQPNFTSNTVNNGGLSPSSLNQPGGVYISEDKLYVVDFGNHRVLVWNSIPTTNNAPANVVLGQPDFISNTSNNGGISDATLNSPWHLYVSGGKLFVSDYGNNRILIWNSLTLSNGLAADVVVGQPNFVSNSANNGGLGAAVLDSPYEVHVSDSKLFVADSENNRILIWNSIPTSNGLAADVVVGQANFTSNSNNQGGAVAANTLRFPSSIYTYNNKLYVTDASNYRVLTYSPIPTSNNASATAVFGQPDFESYTSNVGGVSRESIDYVEGIYVDEHRTILGDAGNSRVLILPTAN